MHNILIKDGTLVDGTGSPGVPRDVAIDGAKIAGIFKHSEAKASMTIDAKGLVVCPGFIDIHSHSEIHLLANPLAESKVRQGVTTELVGNCGGSSAPAIGEVRTSLMDYSTPLCVKVDWTSMDEYLLRLADIRPSVNVATLVGASTLRTAVMGGTSSRPTAAQMTQMKELLVEAMLHGAYGLSSGLIYAPGCFATTDEIVELASASAALGGFYASHIRGEGITLVKAVEEAITIGRRARTRVQISHHKACGRRFWGTVSKTLKMIEDAQAAGVDVAFDVYPYTASCTSLDTVLPPWAREGSKEDVIARLNDAATRERAKKEMETSSDEWEAIAAEDGWENVYLIGLAKEHNRRFENRPMSKVAEELGKDPGDAALDLIVDEDLMAGAIFHEISEDDVIRVMSHPLGSIGSDGEAEAPYGPTSDCATHPRAYGTFPRVLARYVREKKILSLEDAIRKMTSLPADRIGFRDRGRIAPGMAADVVVFDPEKVRDTATFEDSHRFPDGIKCVVVNGLVTVMDGEHTRERAGQVLRHRPSVS